MEDKLVVQQRLTPSAWQMIEQVAPSMHAARFFGVANPEQAMAIMLKGYEMGLPLAASFEFIHVVENRPTLNPRGMLALLHRHPECEGLTITDGVDAQGEPESCTVYMKRSTGFEYTVTFSMTDARRAGLVKARGAWESYPANMLRWRAIGFCADVVFPDVTGGMKRGDELGAMISPNGDVIDGDWSEVTAEIGAGGEPTPVAQVAAESPPDILVITLNDLLEVYGAEAIMVANEGAIPGTNEELVAVADKLAASNG